MGTLNLEKSLNILSQEVWESGGEIKNITFNKKFRPIINSFTNPIKSKNYYLTDYGLLKLSFKEE